MNDLYPKFRDSLNIYVHNDKNFEDIPYSIVLHVIEINLHLSLELNLKDSIWDNIEQIAHVSQKNE